MPTSWEIKNEHYRKRFAGRRSHPHRTCGLLRATRGRAPRRCGGRLRPIPDAERARFRFVRLAALLSVLVCILVLGWRLRTPVQPHPAVQVESRLAQNTPPGFAPGLPGFPAEYIRHSVQSDPDGKNNFAKIQGTVYDEQPVDPQKRKPAQDIEVRIHRLDAKGDFKTKTGRDGRYSYTEIPPGDYVMGILHNGDIVLIRALTLRAGRIVFSDFDLAIPDLEKSGVKAAAFDLLTKEGAARIVSPPVASVVPLVASAAALPATN